MKERADPRADRHPQQATDGDAPSDHRHRHSGGSGSAALVDFSDGQEIGRAQAGTHHRPGDAADPQPSAGPRYSSPDRVGTAKRGHLQRSRDLGRDLPGG
jgi:hypothetical protein